VASVDKRMMDSASMVEGVNNGVSGGMLATWGTGTQGGLKLCYQTPSEINHQRYGNLLQDDRQTMYSEDMSLVSGVNTEIL
jgi:hypothetical protein